MAFYFHCPAKYRGPCTSRLESEPAEPDGAGHDHFIAFAGIHQSYQDTSYHKDRPADRSEEHTSELQSLMRISYAVFCLKTKKKNNKTLYYIKTTHRSTAN